MSEQDTVNFYLDLLENKELKTILGNLDKFLKNINEENREGVTTTIITYLKKYYDKPETFMGSLDVIKALMIHYQIGLTEMNVSDTIRDNKVEAYKIT